MAPVIGHDELMRGHADLASALASLTRMTALGRRHGIVNTPWWRSRLMGRLCLRALEAGLDVAYVRDLIRRRRLVPEEPPVTLEAWPWPVRISTLGTFAVQVDDRPLVFARKAQQKPLAVLQAIVALGGRAVGEDQLVDLLWADAEGDAGHHALKMAILRLRRLLGHERAVVRALPWPWGRRSGGPCALPGLPERCLLRKMADVSRGGSSHGQDLLDQTR
jgi:LuxR family maltose regulon positive regulatory protein